MINVSILKLPGNTIFIDGQSIQRIVNTLLIIKTAAAGFPTGVENMGGGGAPTSQFDVGAISKHGVGLKCC